MRESTRSVIPSGRRSTLSSWIDPVPDTRVDRPVHVVVRSPLPGTIQIPSLAVIPATGYASAVPTAAPPLAGQAAIVTGGASGIGRAIVAALADAGAAVVVADLAAEAAAAVAAELPAGEAFALDVRDADAHRRARRADAGAVRPRRRRDQLRGPLHAAAGARGDRAGGRGHVARARARHAARVPGGGAADVRGGLRPHRQRRVRPGRLRREHDDGALPGREVGADELHAQPRPRARARTASRSTPSRPGTVATPLWEGLDGALRDQGRSSAEVLAERAADPGSPLGRLPTTAEVADLVRVPRAAVVGRDHRRGGVAVSVRIRRLTSTRVRDAAGGADALGARACTPTCRACSCTWRRTRASAAWARRTTCPEAEALLELATTALRRRRPAGGRRRAGAAGGVRRPLRHDDAARTRRRRSRPPASTPRGGRTACRSRRCSAAPTSTAWRSRPTSSSASAAPTAGAAARGRPRRSWRGRRSSSRGTASAC